MEPLSFYNALQECLVLNSRLVGVVGQHVNVGETFTVRLTLTINAPVIGIDAPEVRFDNLHYLVTCTDLARVSGDNGVPSQAITSELEPDSLRNGESASFDVQLLAVAPSPTPDAPLRRVMPALHPLLLGSDLIANAIVFGDLNVSDFFHIRRRWPVFQDIEPT